MNGLVGAPHNSVHKAYNRDRSICEIDCTDNHIATDSISQVHRDADTDNTDLPQCDKVTLLQHPQPITASQGDEPPPSGGASLEPITVDSIHQQHEVHADSCIPQEEIRRVSDTEPDGKTNDASMDCYTPYNDQFFNEIKQDCASLDTDTRGPDPHRLAYHRQLHWPEPTGMPEDLARIYSQVKRSGIPNALGVQIELPSELNLKEWDNVFGKYDKYQELLRFVRFGFPMGYMGPTSNSDDNYNHSSAVDYPDHIDKFLQKEIDVGGIVGPLAKKPFEPWLHVAPLMSRPKRDSDARRIIFDLTFPYERSINAYIMKNAVWGETRDHSLPTVSQLVDKIKDMGSNSYMSTVDIARAYKNFRSDPLDWPLLCMRWKES